MIAVALCITLAYFFVKNRPEKPINKFGIKANQKKRAFLTEHFTIQLQKNKNTALGYSELDEDSKKSVDSRVGVEMTKLNFKKRILKLACDKRYILSLVGFAFGIQSNVAILANFPAVLFDLGFEKVSAYFFDKIK